MEASVCSSIPTQATDVPSGPRCTETRRWSPVGSAEHLAGVYSTTNVRHAPAFVHISHSTCWSTQMHVCEMDVWVGGQQPEESLSRGGV